MRHEGRYGPCEEPKADCEDGRRDGEAGEFVFGLERSVLLAAAAEDAVVVEPGKHAAGEADSDGNECERGLLF